MDYSYLEAKRALDDRSINRVVWGAFERAVTERSAADRRESRILEIGAGSGSMVERLAAWGFFEKVARERKLYYIALEPQEPHIPVLRERLSRRSELTGWETFNGTAAGFLKSRPGEVDVLLAHAVLDLFAAEEAVRLCRDVLRRDGLLYASITFDGESFFEPEDEPELDRRVREAYHESMAREGQVGAGYGRKLLTELPRGGFEVLEAGSSDWIIMPRSGTYPTGEGDFLKAILSMVHGAVEGRVSQEERERWLRRRLAQFDRGELVYIAHQLDILARKVEA